MNLADPELELIDPTPNVHAMFLHFDKLFFWEKLSCRSTVRWSKRMYSCAGTCTYQRGGLCDIALSEPLLKLRPRKDLIETLLHEMIHAYLFITNKDRDRDGHGPCFQAHMHRINRAAGINISIYHDFHDEVKLYQTHWWLCNGPCRKNRPYFGIVRRTCNRAPGPSDYWWSHHKKVCGGTFIKIKEPQKPEVKKQTKPAKPYTDITKYLNNNNKFINKNNTENIKRPTVKDISNTPIKSYISVKSNNGSNLIVTKKNVIFNPKTNKPKPFSGIGQTINGKRVRSSSVGGLDFTRNNGANKQIQNNKNTVITEDNKTGTPLKANKHKAKPHTDSPPLKMKKIDFYLNAIATSTLKDIYGQDFNVTEAISNRKTNADSQIKMVQCPVCKNKIDNGKINSHLDECLSKDLIGNMVTGHIPQNHDSNVAKNDLSYVENIRDNHKISDSQLLKSSSGKTKHTIEKDFKEIVDGRKSSGVIKTNDINLNDSKCKVQSLASVIKDESITIEPGCSNSDLTLDKECLCCGSKLNTSVDEHLYECQSFFDDKTKAQGASRPSSANVTNEIIVINDDDEFDETASLNVTGTKLPCPCCLRMVEEIDMNNHLDKCLS